MLASPGSDLCKVLMNVSLMFLSSVDEVKVGDIRGDVGDVGVCERLLSVLTNAGIAMP